jgi:hypothetical protein
MGRMRSFAVTVGVVLLAASLVRAQEDVQVRMQSWSTALGVECGHCHVLNQWSDASKPVFGFAQRMSRMVNGLNAGALKDLGGVTCWTCHRGRTIPARVPRGEWEKIQVDHAAEFDGNSERALAMSVYAASLGTDCSHCHTANRADNTKPAKAMVARMSAIFDELPKYFDESRQPRTQCYMCHQGKVKPERGPQ